MSEPERRVLATAVLRIPELGISLVLRCQAVEGKDDTATLLDWNAELHRIVRAHCHVVES